MPAASAIPRPAPIVSLPALLYHAKMPAVVACHTNCYGHLGGASAIENVRSAGLQHVEFPIRTAGFQSRRGDPALVTTASTLEQLRGVERLLEQNGVAVSSCTCSGGNPARPEHVDLMRRKLDLASHFGVRHVIADAGSVSSDDERRLVLANLTRLGDHAARLGMTVCFETHRGLCGNHREMLQTMGELDHPHLRLNFDTGNIPYYNENVQVEIALAKTCHLVKHVHLKDSRGGFGVWDFPALGRGGAVDFLRVRQIMRDCGFSGPFSIEIDGGESDADISLPDYHARVVESVEYLRSLGYFES
jgi:inosose dehydratase